MVDNYGSPSATRSRARQGGGFEQVRRFLSTFRPGGAVLAGRVLDVEDSRLAQLLTGLLAGMVLLFGLAVSSPGLFLSAAPTGSIDLLTFLPWAVLACAQLVALAASYRSPAVRQQIDRIALGFCYVTGAWFIIHAGGGAAEPNEAIMLLFALPAIGVGYGTVSKNPLSLVVYFAAAVGAVSVTAFITAGTVPLLFVTALVGLAAVVTFLVTGWIAARGRYVAFEEQYRAVAEQAADGVYLLDAETNTILDANPAFCRMTGMTVPQLQRSRLDDVLLPLATGEPDPASRSRNSLGYLENRILRRPDGRLTPVELRADWIAHKGKSVLSVVVYDVQARDEYEERLLRAKESAEEIASFKSALLSNMSHEIRTPLCSILGWAAVLTNELPDRQRELIGLIEKSGQRLNATLDSVIELAHLHANAKTIRPVLLDVNEVVADTVENVSNLAESKGLQLRLNRADEEVWAELDPSCLRRIIVHIVDNAVKFTDRGAVTVTVSRREEEATIVIEDTGDGISEDFLPSIFEEFRQESVGLARNHEGNGLGLAITRRLVELIDGRIDVVSERGVGSTFTVYVPAIRQPSVAEKRSRRTVARMG